jgi:catecholate siderophore receptor
MTPDRNAAAFLALGCVGFVASFPIPAAAQQSGAPTRLEGVTVRDTAVTQEFRAHELQSPKATAPLLDTPRIVDVITNAVIESSASYSVQEALRTVPGITLGAGEGGVASADIPLIRGLDATADTFVDGARDVGSQLRETFAIEQIEVIKGPNTAFGGRSTSAGTINIVSKTPQATDFISGQVAVGTSDFQRVSTDINQQIGDRLAVRLNAMWHDASVAGRDSVRDDRWGVAPSVTWGVGEPFSATFLYYHYETDGIPDYGVPLTSRNQLPGGLREPVDVDYDNFYGLTARDFQESRADAATFLFKGELAPGWVLSDTLRYSRTRNNFIVTNPDDSRGNVAQGYVWRSTKSRDSINKSLVNNLNLAGDFSTGGLEHSTAVGMEFSTSDTRNRPYVVAAGSGTCTPELIASFNCAPLADPNPDDPWVGSVTRSPTLTKVSAEDLSFYAMDTVTIIPQLLLNGGIRWNRFDVTGRTFAPAGNTSFTNKSDFWSWQGAVILKPVENASIYFSYADSKTPPGSDVGEGSNNLSATNDTYRPQATENWEVGAKADLAGGALSLTGALFQLNRSNIIDNDPLAGPIAVASKARIRGFEVGASGALGPVSILAGYTYVDSEIRDDTANRGNPLPNSPKHNVSVTTTVAVTDRLSVGGGAYHASERWADATRLIRADGYWRFDANASLALNDNLSVRLNVQNVGDERYVRKLRNPHFAEPAAGRQAILTVAARY